jgi:hypothetical protein
VQWRKEPFDPDLLAAVRCILAPVMNKQWDYDAAVDGLKTGSLETEKICLQSHNPVEETEP